MKKFFVAVALVMGLGTTVAFAENLTSGVETVMAVNDFTPIEVTINHAVYHFHGIHILIDNIQVTNLAFCPLQQVIQQ